MNLLDIFVSTHAAVTPQGDGCLVAALSNAQEEGRGLWAAKLSRRQRWWRLRAHRDCRGGSHCVYELKSHLDAAVGRGHQLGLLPAAAGCCDA